MKSRAFLLALGYHAHMRKHPVLPRNRFCLSHPFRGLCVAFLLAILLVSLAFAQKAPAPEPLGELRYLLDYAEETNTLVLDVQWRPTADGTYTDFQLCGSGWGGVRNCEASLAALELPGSPNPKPVAAPWRVMHREGVAALRVHLSRTPAPTSAPDVFRRPIVTQHWVHLVGHTAFPIPRALGREDRLRVVIDAGVLVARFGHVNISWSPGKSRASREVSAEQVGAVVLTAGGTVSGRVESTGSTGIDLTEVRLLKDGSGPPVGELVYDLLNGYFTYYGRRAIQQTLVLVPVAADAGPHPPINGITLPGVISLMLPESANWDDPERRRVLAHFLAHEIGHIWIGQTLRAGPREAELAWFIEGFNNHVTRTVLYRSGVYPLEDYLWSLNQTLALHQKNPNRHLGNRDLATRWPGSQGYMQMTPYLRGDLVALWLNQRLSANPDAPDLRDLLQRLLADPSMHELEPEALIGALGGPLSEADRLFLRGMILDGKPIPLEPGHFAPCLTPVRKENQILYGIAPGGAEACPALL